MSAQPVWSVPGPLALGRLGALELRLDSGELPRPGEERLGPLLVRGVEPLADGHGWRLAVLPLAPGTFTVPPLALGEGVATAPLRITVPRTVAFGAPWMGIGGGQVDQVPALGFPWPWTLPLLLPLQWFQLGPLMSLLLGLLLGLPLGLLSLPLGLLLSLPLGLLLAPLEHPQFSQASSHSPRSPKRVTATQQTARLCRMGRSIRSLWHSPQTTATSLWRACPSPSPRVLLLFCWATPPHCKSMTRAFRRTK